MESRPLRVNLFMGKKERQKEEQRNMRKLKVIYRIFANALLRNGYPCCHRFGACLPCIYC